MKPGVWWPDMQTLAYKCILSGLAAGGLLVGDVDDMIRDEVGGLFMPHGKSWCRKNNTVCASAILRIFQKVLVGTGSLAWPRWGPGGC